MPMRSDCPSAAAKLYCRADIRLAGKDERAFCLNNAARIYVHNRRVARVPINLLGDDVRVDPNIRANRNIQK